MWLRKIIYRLQFFLKCTEWNNFHILDELKLHFFLKYVCVSYMNMQPLKIMIIGLPYWLRNKESACQGGRHRLYP